MSKLDLLVVTRTDYYNKSCSRFNSTYSLMQSTGFESLHWTRDIHVIHLRSRGLKIFVFSIRILKNRPDLLDNVLFFSRLYIGMCYYTINIIYDMPSTTFHLCISNFRTFFETSIEIIIRTQWHFDLGIVIQWAMLRPSLSCTRL